MKKAFKFTLLITLLLLSGFATAQKISIEAGFTNPARYGSGLSTTYLNGNQLGLTTVIPLKNNFSLLTGALYTIVYADKKQGYPNSDVVNYYTFGHFADVPLRAMYTLPVSKSLRFFAYAGPNLNIGLSQLQITNSTLSAIPSGSTNMYASDLNRLNLQLGLGGGVQWNKLTLKGGYDFGLLNLNKKSTTNIYQRGWHVSMAYELGEIFPAVKKEKAAKKPKTIKR
jgi:hypothetical protein